MDLAVPDPSLALKGSEIFFLCADYHRFFDVTQETLFTAEHLTQMFRKWKLRRAPRRRSPTFEQVESGKVRS